MTWPEESNRRANDSVDSLPDIAHRASREPPPCPVAVLHDRILLHTNARTARQITPLPSGIGAWCSQEGQQLQHSKIYGANTSTCCS